MVRIYTDTNVLRYFGIAFAETNLAEDLQDHLLLSPLSVMELLAQLGTDDAEPAFAAVHAIARVHNTRACGMLPWSDNAFRSAIFSLPPRKNEIMPSLNNALLNALNAEKAEDMCSDGEEFRYLLEECKAGWTISFSAVLEGWRSEGPLSEEEHRAVFARSIARRAGVDETAIDMDLVISGLNALYVFENAMAQRGVENLEYNVAKHSNDVFDAELLAYLSDPSLHLLTSDKGFRRVESSSQADRVHIVEAHCLQDPERATATIRGIVEADTI